ncbi:MAG: carbon-nitrogen hydrolase, partial [Tannerella sp.]|nr:carbon-nitrogen hydrolase [Tannerella sp.]
MKTGIIQQHNTGNVEENIERLCAGIHRCAAEGAQLVVLPELHNSLYFCQTEDERQFGLAETVPGPSTRRFGRLAAQTGVVLTLSLFERRAAGVYHNTAVVIERDGSIAGCYRKMHIPDDPGYYEKYYFAPGDTGFRPIATSVGRLGVMVCWDQWFPEAARLMALRGADVLICPTAIGWDMHDTEGERTRQRDAWQTVQRGHAIANGLPYVAVNRVGPELDPSFQSQGIMFWGSSFAAGPQGEWLCEMSSREGEEAVVDIDMRRTG